MTSKMNKHTPGPWAAGLTENRKVPALVVGATSACGFAPLVCHVQSADIDIGNANARLIAAAPELLSALQGLLKGIFDGPDEANAAMLVAKARDAVNKATKGK